MIQVSDLSFHYPSNGSAPEVLRDVSLTIQDGESIAIMGANGSAKTTFARCLNGLLTPSKGKVLVDNLSTQDENNLAEIRRLVGMVFQNPENQIVSTTVEREIAFGLENIGVPREQMHGIVDQMLQQFNLESYRNHPPHLLSGGEMQRLAVASVVAMSPKYLIFDEPTSLLDAASRKSVLSIIADLQKTRNTSPSGHSITPILITQYPEEVLVCERLIVLHVGEIVFDNRPAKVLQKVDELKAIGLGVPVEFEVNHYLQELSDGRFSLNPSEFLPIP
ncbi:ATP-binding cassette domain-containing protein [bacterium]|nr:ATP-binding cassette domain-containing protein [bacterium]